MRELGDQHALDGDDSGADAARGHDRDVGQPRYEAVPDAAAQRASALEYRQRVAAAYAAYDAARARPQESPARAGRQPEAPAGDQPDTGPPTGHDTPRQPPRGPDEPGGTARPGEPEDAWPPPEADQDRVRKLYREYLADMTSAGRQGGRDQGTNVVGRKPDQSPDETSDMPPPGDELTEIESSKKSRFGELFREAEKEENLDGLHDAVEEYSSTVQRWLSARPPEGHAEAPVPAHHPYIAPWVPEHGIEGGDAASAVMVAGILTAHMARWIDGKLRHEKGDHDDGNR
jgi:hypothetical protein